MSDTTVNIDAFASPDTICKYCGEDFKFFRALKHHLRSHSSCRHKPYMCKICSNGFSTKANCVRHVQKQHSEIEHNQLERQIQVNEFLLEKYGEGDSKEEDEGKGAELLADSHDAQGEAVTVKLEEERTSAVASAVHQHQAPGVVTVGKKTHEAIRAHLAAKLKPPTRMSPVDGPSSHTPHSVNASPRFLGIKRPGPPCGMVQKQDVYITSPPIVSIKTEQTEEDVCEQPLDFSRKQHTPDIKPEMQRPQDNLCDGSHVEVTPDDQPMDLTVKKSAGPPSAGSTYPTVAHSVPGSSSLSILATPSPSPSGGMAVAMETKSSSQPHMSLISPSSSSAARLGQRVSKEPQISNTAMRLPVFVEPGMGRGNLSLPPHLMAAGPDYGMLRYKKEYQKFYTPLAGKLQCPYCKMLFKHGLKVS